MNEKINKWNKDKQTRRNTINKSHTRISFNGKEREIVTLV